MEKWVVWIIISLLMASLVSEIDGGKNYIISIMNNLSVVQVVLSYYTPENCHCVFCLLAFGPPHITVYCMEDYETLHKYINATWKPNPLANFTAEELHDRLQNCEAAVTCSNGHTELVCIDKNTL